MKKIEGTYVYQCCECGTLFAVVARLSVEKDREISLACPKCLAGSDLKGEGHAEYRLYEKERAAQCEEIKSFGYPIVLTAHHISEILGVSKQVVYDLMQSPSFPLIKINRFKRVKRDAFFEWLDDQEAKTK